jgi:penicillin-binding protein 2
VFFVRSYDLQIVNGKSYLSKSENNRLNNILVFSNRGIIYDRNDKKLAWNSLSTSTFEHSLRKYSTLPGLSHVLGYLKYPQKDKTGYYYSEEFVGKTGVEKYYNDVLSGENGLRIIEVDAQNNVQSESTIRPPQDGKDIKLSIDADLQSHIYDIVSELSNRVGFTGGAGVLMDVNTGEILALTSYPEYSSQIMTDGTNKNLINKYLTNKNNPFLNRIIDGLYTPGSIVKPFMSLAALSEKIIDPSKKILSTGSISIQNPYDPTLKTVFKDWKAHGWVDMRKAIAVSSDVYFYAVGGGYEDQKGLGILNIDKYMSMFGFGKSLPEGFFKSNPGVIPTPEWKAKNFEDGVWRLGNTYHTAIGQYGFQVNAIQAVRAVASIANDGKLLEPSIIYGGDKDKFTEVGLSKDDFKIVKEGMRMGVTDGIAAALNVSYVKMAIKTGTAELGSKKQFVNSWITGFFPYEHPRYAFAIIMERGPVANTTGGVYVMRQVMDWIHINKPEYLKDYTQ